jgi:pantetheine-phosphate adenylyltransferase
MASEAYSFVSSRLVKQVASLGGDVTGMVPTRVAERLKSSVISRQSSVAGGAGNLKTDN